MADSKDNRRREPRAMTAALIEMTDEYADKSVCVLEDVSAAGACVHSDIPFRAGSSVSLKCGAVEQNATVKYCEPAADGFNVGVEFVSAPWPTPIEMPIHWIRGEKLM